MRRPAPVPPLDPQRLNAAGSVFLTRPTLDDHVATRDELTWRARELFDAVARRELDVRIGATFPLADAADAHRALEVALHHRKGPAAPVSIPTLNTLPAVRTLQVEVWSDIACPWCYIGKRRFAAALADFPHREHVAVTWRRTSCRRARRWARDDRRSTCSPSSRASRATR